MNISHEITPDNIQKDKITKISLPQQNYSYAAMHNCVLGTPTKQRNGMQHKLEVLVSTNIISPARLNCPPYQAQSW